MAKQGVIPVAKRWKFHDHVHIEKLKVKAVVGPDSWDQLKPQNLNISLHMSTDFSKSSRLDDLKYSLNYAVISKDIGDYIKKNSKRNFKDLVSIGKTIIDYTKKTYPGIIDLKVEVQSKEGNIRSNDIKGIVHSSDEEKNEVLIADFKMLTLIGVFTFERMKRQFVDFTIRLPVEDGSDVPPYNTIISQITDYVEKSNFKTVEALVETVSQVILTQNDYFLKRPKLPISVKVIKLNAISETDGVGVSCSHCYDDFRCSGPVVMEQAEKNETLTNFDLPVNTFSLDKDSWKSAVLAFGSNVGDRFKNIVDAMNLLNAHEQVKIISTSSLFESNPMYFKDQTSFLNGCVKIKTRLLPDELLKICKKIEYDELRRIKHFDNGPRTIDLDIVIYYDSTGQDVTVNTEVLTIPHPRLIERSFVLEPLCELVSPTQIHPITAETFHDHLNQLYQNENSEDLLWKVVPTGDKFLKFRTEWQRDLLTDVRVPVSKSNGYLMGIVNVTPDSFSDGSAECDNVSAVMNRIETMVSEALELHDMIVLDIGGCSTRPGSIQASEEEELSRTIPIIDAVTTSKTLPLDKIVLSMDTYRSAVAEAAILAGVGIINDISGGTFDPKILQVVGKYPNVAYVLSHIRGTIESMSTQTSYLTTDDAVDEFILDKKSDSDKDEILFIRTIGREVCSKFEELFKNNIFRWQLFLDPGIGFAKVGKQNLDIIKHLQLLKNYSCIKQNEYYSLVNLPVLLGPSRKKFIGDITNIPVAKDRDFVTGAILSSALANGCDIVRVHDVRNNSKVLKLANELYRD